MNVSAASEEVTEPTEMTEVIVAIEMTEEVVTGEAEAVLMTDEEATAIRAHLLQGFATTDTEALLQRAELTATSQAAHIETTLPAGAARLPTIAHAAVPPPHPQGAAAAILPASRALAHHHPARLADTATTGQHREMLLIAKTTAKAKASAVKAADPDPVRVLLLTSVAHDHPDATANPTTPAAEGRPRTTADPLLRRSVTAELHPQYRAHHLEGAAMPQNRDPAHVHLQDVETSEMTKSLCHAPNAVTSVG